MNDLTSELRDIDRGVVDAAKSIKVLSNLNWVPAIGEEFLRDWESGNPTLPRVSYSPPDLSASINSLKQLQARCPTSHPLGRFIANTAGSYIQGGEMLMNLGRAQFTEISSQIYGTPTDPLFSSSVTHLEAANRFISATDEFQDICHIPEASLCIRPEAVAEELRARMGKVFRGHIVNVVVDPLLSAKAAAGATRVRIRGSSSFSQTEVDQLAEHECFVHTLTAINGRTQSNLQCLGLGAPRTTRTQEGLALFAELITRTIDLNRLRRIAMRTRAVQMGLDGADFLEVFKFMIDAHFSPPEAFVSTFRVFRGGDVRGRVVFTKDCTYLGGLAEVHTFLRKAIQHGEINYPHYLCAGRVALSDIFLLEEQFKSGVLQLPLYEPSWITDRPRLTAFLIYSNFLNTIPLAQIDLDHFKASNAGQ